MDVVWLGHASFLLRGKSAKVVTDPYDSKVMGFRFPSVEADIVTVSHDHPDHNGIMAVDGPEGLLPFVIKGPGEYEIKGVSVFGTATYHDDTGGSQRGKNTVFVIEIDGIKVCHLGDLGHKLTDAQLREVGQVDVLLVPVGGFYTIDAQGAAGVVAQLEPKVVIPMHYKTDELKGDAFAKVAGVEPFLKEMGLSEVVPLPKAALTRDKLPEQTQVIILEKKTA